MAHFQRPQIVEAHLNQLISATSDKTPPSHTSAPVPGSKIEIPQSPSGLRKQPPSDPFQRRGSPVEDSLDIVKDRLPDQKLVEIAEEPISVKSPVENLQHDDRDIYDLNFNGQAPLSQIGTSQTGKSILTATNLTTPSMAPKQSSKSSNARKSAGKTSRNQPSQSIQAITNTGTTSSLAALKSMKAAKASHSDNSQQSPPDQQKQPAEESSTVRQACSTRQAQTQPAEKGASQKTQKTQKSSQNQSAKTSLSKSQSKPSKTVPDTYDDDLELSPERTQSKPLRDPKSSTKPSDKKPPSKQPPTKAAASRKSDTKQPPSKKSSTKQPASKKTSADQPAPKRRSGEYKSNARIIDSDEEADHSDGMTSKAEPTTSTRNTRANARAQNANNAPGGESAPIQLQSTARTRKKQTANPPQHGMKASDTLANESYREFEDSVTNLNDDGPAEAVVRLHEGQQINLLENKAHADLDAQVKIKKENMEASQRLPKQDNAIISSKSGASKDQPIPVISIEDDDLEESTSGDSSTGDDGPAPSGLIFYNGETEQDLYPQDMPLQTPAAVAPSSPPRLPNPNTGQSDLVKEHSSHKPNMIHFSENGPQNQGVLGSKKKATSRLLSPSGFHVDPKIDNSLHVDEEQVYHEQVSKHSPSKQPTDHPADILEGMIGRQSRVRGQQLNLSSLKKQKSLTKEPRTSDSAVANPSKTTTSPSIPLATINPGSTKRPNMDDIGGPVKRSKHVNEEKTKSRCVETPMLKQENSRRESQHTVNEDGSPIPSKLKQIPANTSPMVMEVHESAGLNLPQRQTVQEDPSSFFLAPAITRKMQQRGGHAAQEENSTTCDQHKRQADTEVESQAISHVGLGELTEDCAERGEESDAQEHPFAGIEKHLMSEQSQNPARNGLMDLLRSKITKDDAHAEPEDAHSDGSQEDESDPDRTLVNDESDEDSARSSDTDVQDRQDDELSEWKNALKSHQGEVHDALIRIAHGFTMHLVDHETAIGDIVGDFGRDGGKIIKQLEDQHEADLEEYSRQVLFARKNLTRGFKLTKTSLFEDLEEIKESGDYYIETRQKQVDVSKRLDQLEAYF